MGVVNRPTTTEGERRARGQSHGAGKAMFPTALGEAGAAFDVQRAAIVQFKIEGAGTGRAFQDAKDATRQIGQRAAGHRERGVPIGILTGKFNAAGVRKTVRHCQRGAGGNVPPQNPQRDVRIDHHHSANRPVAGQNHRIGRRAVENRHITGGGHLVG